MGHPDLIVASNRGPVSFHRSDSGELEPSRGAGGLVSSLGPLLEGTGAAWIAAAMSDDDREAATKGLVEAEGFRLRLLDIDAATYRMAYDVVSNGTLWFLFHHLFDLPRRPHIDRRWREAWEGYRRLNHAFARAISEEAPEGATVLVQDYHLTLVGATLAEVRPDLRAVHFSHTPFCDPAGIRVLPADVAEQLLGGMAAHVACGFHTRRWAEAFEACCDQVLGTTPRTFVAPLAPDHADISGVAASPACAEQLTWLEEQVGDRRLILRVDRIELSKNLHRGFLAYDDLLATRPEWRERVVFAAFIYPSRESLPEYQAYRQEVETIVARINQQWGTETWTPILLDMSDDFPRSVAALRRYDVLLVNPVRDGLNLVAKEGPLINEQDGVLVLSREAGAWEEMADGALEVNPFDIAGTADVIAEALALSVEERATKSKILREAAGRRTPEDWLQEQLAAAQA